MRSVTAIALTLAGLLVLGAAGAAPGFADDDKEKSEKENPVVILETSMGNIHVELYPEEAPITAENFLSYVREGFYDGLIFHRVIRNFMIQGGGFTPDMQQKATQAPIKNEAGNGLGNERGTLAMARTQIVDSATSQFFINVVDNAFLNHRDETPQGFGYCVFGRVTEGMDVVEKIRAVDTGTRGHFKDVPVRNVMITRAYVQGEEKAEETVEPAEDKPSEPASPAEMKTTEKADDLKER